MTTQDQKEIYGAGSGGGGGGRGRGGGGQQIIQQTTVVNQPAPAPYQPTRVDDDEHLRSVSFAKMQYLLCEGEIEGPAYGTSQDTIKERLEKSVYLDGTPLRSLNGTSQFQPEDLVLSYGTNIQDAVPDYDVVETPFDVSRVVKKDIPVSKFLEVPDIGASYKARVLITFQSLYYGDSRGNLLRTTVTYKVQYTDSLGVTRDVTPAGGEVLNGKFSSQFVRQHQFDLEGSSPWNVTVTRVTEDDDDRNNGYAQYGSTFTFSNVTLSLKQKMRYPASAILTLGLRADTYQNIPDVTVHLKGTKVQIPSNYDPETRTYSGLWDGTFATQPAYTNNPAWVFYAIATNERWGLGKYIEPELIDKWTLYDIGRYCDQSVRKNNEGTETEPRFVCNLLLQTAEDAWVVLQQIATIFRGMLYYSGGSIIPVQNRDQNGDGTTIKPVFTFNESNTLTEYSDNGEVSLGNFSYAGVSRRARHTAVLVSYDDEDADYISRVEYLQDDEGLERYGYRALDLRLIGVTSRGQALRAANWALLTEKLLDDTVTFKTNELGSLVRPGDLIEIADPNKTENQARRGGRISGISGNLVTLDSSQTLPNGVSSWTGAKLYFMIRGSEEPRMESGTVTSISGSTVSISAWESTERPLVGDPWLLELGTVTGGVTYRVLTVSEEEQGIYAIAALRHRADIFSTVDTGTPLQDSEQFGITIVKPSAPTITSIKTIYTNEQMHIAVYWTTPSNSITLYGVDTGIDHYTVQYQAYDGITNDSDGHWITIDKVSDNSILIPFTDYDRSSYYKVRVASVTRLNTQSDWSTPEIAEDLFTSSILPDIANTIIDPSYDPTSSALTSTPDVPYINYSEISYVNNTDGSHTFSWIFNGEVPAYIKGVELQVKPKTTPLTSTEAEGLGTVNADGYYVLGEALLDETFTWTLPSPQEFIVRMRFVTYVAEIKGDSYRSVVVSLSDIIPPIPVQFFVSTEVERTTENALRRFSWLLPNTNYTGDLNRYQVRYIAADQVYSSGNDYWNNAFILDSANIPNGQTWFETSLIPPGYWRIMIVAIDNTNFVSGGYAEITIDLNHRLTANIVERVDMRETGFPLIPVIGSPQGLTINNFHPYTGVSTGPFYRAAVEDNLYELNHYGGQIMEFGAGPFQVNTMFYCGADQTALQILIDTPMTYKTYIRKADVDDSVPAYQDAIGISLSRAVTVSKEYMYAHGDTFYAYEHPNLILEQYFYPPTGSGSVILSGGTTVQNNKYWVHMYEPTMDTAVAAYHLHQEGERVEEGFYQIAIIGNAPGTDATLINSSIADIDVVMDYPDIREAFDNIYVPVEGTTISFKNRYRKVVGVSTAFQAKEENTGTSVKVISRTNYSLTLSVTSSPGVPGDGYVDVLVAGY